MLEPINTDEQAEVARAFKDVRERAVGFQMAADAIDSFMDEVDSADLSESTSS